MIGGHAKVKVFQPEHDDYLDVSMKTMKGGRSATTRGWTRVVYAICMEEGTIWAFRFTLFISQNVFGLFLYCIYLYKYTTVDHHSLFGSYVIDDVYL